MAWQTAVFTITGVAPLISHNGQTADPLNEFSLRIKEISKKRKKTEDDFARMERIEFEAGLYMNGNGPYVPADNVDAMILAAAKKVREGQLAKAGLLTQGEIRLIYDGPRDVEGLWSDEQRRFKRAVRVGTAKVMRMRPIFPEWSGKVEVMYETSIVNLAQLTEWMTIAGAQIGLGDWRPRYGRFESELVK